MQNAEQEIVSSGLEWMEKLKNSSAITSLAPLTSAAAQGRHCDLLLYLQDHGKSRNWPVWIWWAELSCPGRLLLKLYQSRQSTPARLPVNKWLRSASPHFARHGFPNVVILNIGPQFSSCQFDHFSKQYQFGHHPSRPHYSQSNGKAEKAVQFVKNLTRKSKADKQDFYLALL